MGLRVTCKCEKQEEENEAKLNKVNRCAGRLEDEAVAQKCNDYTQTNSAIWMRSLGAMYTSH